MSKDLLFSLYNKAKEKEVIDRDLIKFLENIYPDKSKKILQVIEKGLTKYIYKPSNRIVWIALGEEKEHIIYPNLYCSCLDFYKSVVIKRKRQFCKHLLAQIVCMAMNNYQKVELEDNEFKNLIKDLKLKF